MPFAQNLTRLLVIVFVLALGLATVVGCASAPAKVTEAVKPAVSTAATVTPTVAVSEPVPETVTEAVTAADTPVEPVPEAVAQAEPEVATVPDEAPADQPVSEEVASKEPEPEAVVEPGEIAELPPPAAPLDPSELEEANTAIAAAEAAEADTYIPDLMASARAALEEAKNKAESDPDAARELLKTAAGTAREALEASLALRLQAIVAKLAKASELLKAQKADKWQPTEWAALDSQRQEAEIALTDDYETGLSKAQAALEAMTTSLDSLTERLATVQALQKSVLTSLDEADSADAFVWVPDQLQQANDTYFAGTGFWKRFQLDKAEEAFTAALFQAQAVTAKAIRELARKQTEQLMLETMRKLEKASGATVVDPQDNIIGPKPWSGTEQLKNLKKPQSLIAVPPIAAILSRGTVVMGDTQRITYLDEAKDAWGRGVEAMYSEDYPLANQEFLQAQRLIQTYLALAVDKVYTVRLVPGHRDSLWRISEYDAIYASPWDWPKIWKRNQKLIQNPDLIFPGWQLIIPPQ